MFDLTNVEFIKKVIDSRDDNMLIIPLYVKIYHNTYSLIDLPDIREYNPASFKVGFGTSIGLEIKNSFPNNHLLDMDVIHIIRDVDKDTGVISKYLIFESDDVDGNEDILFNQIHQYVTMIKDRCNMYYTKYKSSLVND